jgi:hypothetical protein
MLRTCYKVGGSDGEEETVKGPVDRDRKQLAIGSNIITIISSKGKDRWFLYIPSSVVKDSPPVV